MGPRRSQITGRMLGGLWSTEAGSPSRFGLKSVAPEAKPRSKRSAAFWVRSFAEGAPMTTVMRRRPLRLAVATTLKPEAQMKPVFIPSAPG